MAEISNSEYADRLAGVRQRINDAGLDAFLVTDSDNFYYLTGASYKPFERPFFMLIDGADNAEILVPLLEKGHMQKVPDLYAVRTYREYPMPVGEGWAVELEKLLGSRKRIGVDPATPISTTRDIRGGAVEALDLVEQQRLVKSDREIELLRRSARFSVRATQRLMELAGPGKRAAEGFLAKGGIMQEIIGSLPEWEVMTTDITMATFAGTRSADPHSIPEITDIVDQGPNVALVLCRVNGHATECERTFFASEPTEKDRTRFADMLEARRIGFSMVRPGARGHDIDAAVTDFLVSRGYANNLLHRTGHGLGISAHEGPWIARGSDHVLEANMLISMEPGIYFTDRGAYRHSDTILVTEDGYEVLTPLPTSIEEMTLDQAVAA